MRMWLPAGINRVPIFPHLLGAVEDGVVVEFEVRGAFDGAAATDDRGGFVDLTLGETETTQEIELRRLPARLRGCALERGGMPMVQGEKANANSNWAGSDSSILQLVVSNT